MTSALPSPRRLAGVGEVGFYDAVYVSTYEWDAVLSCAGRIASDRRRGLRGLIVVVHDGGDAAPLGADQMTLGLASAAQRRPDDEPSSQGGGLAAREDAILDLAHSLEDVFRRSRARSLFIPLGVGGHIDSLTAHEAGLRTFHAGSGRDVYLYEERPEAFILGSVRIRLAQLGARLPPAAVRVAGEGGLLRLLLRTQTVPRLRDPAKGLRSRFEIGRRMMRRWYQARAWRPLRALGPRLQPLIVRPEAARLDDVRDLVRIVSGRFRGRVADRLLKLGADHARRLGGGEWTERLWLLLPEREGTVAAHAASYDSVGLVS
jgi:hypothetical protein